MMRDLQDAKANDGDRDRGRGVRLAGSPPHLPTSVSAIKPFIFHNSSNKGGDDVWCLFFGNQATPRWGYWIDLMSTIPLRLSQTYLSKYLIQV